MAKSDFIWRIEFLHPAMWHDYDIDIVNRDSEQVTKSQLITSFYA